MSSKHKNLSTYDESNMPDISDKHFGIVVADWNKEVTHALYEACYDTLVKHGAKEDHIETAQVPGAYELPIGARILNTKLSSFDAIVCLGCVIKGETSHNEYINTSVASGLTQLGLMTGIPHIFGLLTPNDMQQALDRAGGKYGNKGVEAAYTAIRMVGLKEEVKPEKKKIGFSG